MKQLIRLRGISLYKMSRTKTSDGEEITTPTLISSYKVIEEELRDEISSNIYGADIVNMVRFSSIRNELEKYLYNKLNNTSDNISMYELWYGQHKYKITNLTLKYVDGKRYE